MSRQAKSSPQAAPPVPGAVAQQAQQYLEQNIMAWMQPKPQGQPIVSSMGQMLISQKALQEHNMAQQCSPKHSSQSRPGYLPAAPSVAGTSCIGIPPSSCIPHSLSFSGYSHHSLLQGTSFSSPCPSVYGPGAAQPSAAASFFARAAQRLNLSSKKRRRQNLYPHARGHGAEVVEPPCFRTNFCDVLRSSAPSVPPSLLRSLGRKENFAFGKVKVMLRIAPSSGTSCEASPFLNVDSRKKQLTVFDPTLASSSPTTDRNRTGSGISAPKMFAFDAIFSPDDTQTEVCSSTLPDVIQSVVGGTDGCLFVYGHSKLGKTHTMIGSSDSVQGLGVIPCAIWWLFRLIHEQRQKTGARFSVRLSALEIFGRNEILTDLLSEYAAGTEGSGTSPGVYLREDPVLGAQLINASELRAPSAEKAAYLLDAALAARSTDDEGKDSHFLFTLHVYQYRVDRSGKGGVAGGRSRLHLFDFGSCEKTQSKPREPTCSNLPTSLSFSALGNVILALFNGQKHLPNKESKLTQMLKEATNNLSCRVAMIAHISSNPQHYSEVLATVQLAARIHRMRRKKMKVPSTMENVYDEKGACVRPFVRMHAEDGIKSGNSDADYTSSSEQSCDTVIFVGTGRMSLSDRRQPDHAVQTISKLGHQKSPNSESKEPATSANASCAPQRKQELLRDANKHLSPATSKVAVKEAPSVKSNYNSGVKECSRSKQQPASTQTPRTECTNSPMKVSTAQRKKHKTTVSKHDNLNAKEQVQAIAVSKAGSVKENKPQSDETWIDGPRFSKPKFDSKTLHRLQKEQWVDGPPVIYGFMDDHKQSMIRKWVEEHTHHLENKGQNLRPKNEDKKESCELAVVSVDSNSKESEEKIMNTSNDISSRDEPEYAVPNRVRTKQNTSATEDRKLENTSRNNTDFSCYGIDLNSEHDEVDSASNSADVDETDNEENVENGAYNSDLQYVLSADEEYNRKVETIEVVEPDEPIPTMDSCLQVNEEDIIAECWFQSTQSSFKIPFSDFGQTREHPLRVLSEEGLNLPSSFSDTRSVSIDLDSVSVPDTCRDIYKGKGGVTWRLLYGNMFQKIKEQQQMKQMNETKLGNDSSIDEKLRQISRLREMVRPLVRREKPDKTSLPMSYTTFRTQRDAWPSNISCYALSEMMHRSSDSSLSEDLSEADINSTKSEPAELDLDKYDFKFNVKPMNGLKLEAFYNKIHKVPPFSEHCNNLKPTQVVPPLISDEENKQLLDKIDSFQLENFTKERSNSFSHRPPLKNVMRDALDAPSFLRKPTFSSFHDRFETASNPQLNQLSFQPNTSKFSTSEIFPDNAPSLIKNSASLQRNLETIRKVDNSHSSESVGGFKRTDPRPKSGTVNAKTIDTRQLTVGPSPTNSSKTRTSQRSKLNDSGKTFTRDQPPSSLSNSSIQSNKLSFSSSSISSKSAQRTGFSNNSKTPHGKHSNNNNNIDYCSSNTYQSKTDACNKRTSPTSNGSTTSGVTTTCCSTAKQKEKSSYTKGKSSQQEQSKHKRCESKRQAKNSATKSICRSTSSPSTCVDSGETVLTDVTDSSDHYYVSRHASISNTLAPSSPYHKVVQSRHHNHNHHHRHHKQRTSSSNCSDDSSVNSLEPREAKDMLVIKGTTKTQQFSGTSSGYESMLRDSEGTPLTSSQESGTEGSVSRGRKGRRKSQGSSKRSLSAPARSPASSTSATRPPATVNQQPSSDSTGGAVLLLRPRTALDRRSDEEICCPSLLCCRLLDFY